MEIVSAATLLFLVMDPLGNIPIFLSVLEDVAPERRTRVLLRELVLAFMVLVLFLFFGQYLLGFLQLSEHSIRIAGGIILFLIALKMVFPVSRSAHAAEEIQGEPLLVPLAIPMVAGPSAMAIVMLMASNDPTRMPEWLIALFAAWLLSSRASSIVLPIAISVTIDDVAIAAPQPKVLNFTSLMTLSSTLRNIFMISPQEALPTSPTPLASSISPTFRGLVK